MRLLGAVAPNTDAGTIAGNPAMKELATTPLPVVAMNSRRVDFLVFVMAAIFNAYLNITRCACFCAFNINSVAR